MVRTNLIVDGLLGINQGIIVVLKGIKTMIKPYTIKGEVPKFNKKQKKDTKHLTKSYNIIRIKIIDQGQTENKHK